MREYEFEVEAVRGQPVSLSAAETRTAVQSIHLSGRRRWPEVKLTEAALYDYLLRIGVLPSAADTTDLTALLLKPWAIDFYLAAACVKPCSDERAMSELRRIVVYGTPRWLRKFNLEPDVHEEVVQQICIKLFLRGERGAEPALESYRGQGPMRAWLRSFAPRVAANFLRDQKKPQDKVQDAARAPMVPSGMQGSPSPTMQLALALLSSQHKRQAIEPDVANLRVLHGPQFIEILAQALAELLPMERNWLRWRYLKGSTLKEMARLTCNPPIAASNLCEKIQLLIQRLNARVRVLVKSRMAEITETELHSLLDQLMSQLVDGMRELLAEPTEPDMPPKEVPSQGAERDPAR